MARIVSYRIRTFGYQPLVAVATITEYGQYRTTYSLTELSTEEQKDTNVLKEIMADDLSGAVSCEPRP